MLILLKTTAGLDIATSKGTLSLKGFGLLNDVSNELWAEAKKTQCVRDMLDNGYIVESSNKAENAKADTIAEVQSKQAKTKSAKVVKE